MSPLDDELRRTLAVHAGDVPPMLDPLTAVESRARGIHRRRQAIGGACAAAVLVSAAIVVPLLARNTSPAPEPNLSPTVTATASGTAPSATPTAGGASTPAVSTSAPASTRPSAAAAALGEAVAVYYLGDTGTDFRLYREWRRTTATDHVRAAVELMLGRPLDPDYTTLWPTGTTVNSVTVTGDLATVDLGAAALRGTGGSGAACRTLQQLVWTVTAANPAIHRVALSVEGRMQGVVSQWWGAGCGPDAPMVRHTPSFEVLAPVQILTYNDGDQVRSRFSFGGDATVFEAVVAWSVVDASGVQLAGGPAQASKGAPARGEWKANVVLKNVKKGDVVQLRAWESSPKDGSVTNLDTKTVTISG